MSARAEIFVNIRRALEVTGQEAPRRRCVEDRLEHAPKGVVPIRGQGDATARIALFRDEAERVSASLAEVDSSMDVPASIATHLREHSMSTKIRMGADPRLAAMPWATTDIEVLNGRATATDLVCVSHAFGAVAETGSLVLASGPDNPTTLNFLPDTHIVILRAPDIVPDFEHIWQKLRAAYGKGLMPRTVNFITGPSRSADIGHNLLLGAHGPRTLHIIIVIGEG